MFFIFAFYLSFRQTLCKGDDYPSPETQKGPSILSHQYALPFFVTRRKPPFTGQLAEHHRCTSRTRIRPEPYHQRPRTRRRKRIAALRMNLPLVESDRAKRLWSVAGRMHRNRLRSMFKPLQAAAGAAVLRDFSILRSAHPQIVRSPVQRPRAPHAKCEAPTRQKQISPSMQRKSASYRHWRYPDGYCAVSEKGGHSAGLVPPFVSRKKVDYSHNTIFCHPRTEHRNARPDHIGHSRTEDVGCVQLWLR